MSTTPERKEEIKLKKGDHVVMHTCIEAETHNGRIWTCKSDQFTRGTGVYEQDSVFLEGYTGSFAPEFLQKVILPTEDERLLAALEEAQQQLKETEDWEEDAYAWRDFCNERNNLDATEFTEDNFTLLRRELAEAQQTIARQREALNFYASGKHIELNAVNEMVSAESGYKARAAIGETQP